MTYDGAVWVTPQSAPVDDATLLALPTFESASRGELTDALLGSSATMLLIVERIIASACNVLMPGFQFFAVDLASAPLRVGESLARPDVWTAGTPSETVVVANFGTARSEAVFESMRFPGVEAVVLSRVVETLRYTLDIGVVEGGASAIVRPSTLRRTLGAAREGAAARVRLRFSNEPFDSIAWRRTTVYVPAT